MDQQLWHTQKLESIGVLAGGVAHDFNNLLMGILGNASLGLEVLTDVRSTERVLRDIIAASERAADLTRQLLAYSGKGRFVIQAVDLSRLVSTTVPLVRASFPRKLDLVLNLSPSLPVMNGDKTQIEQVVMNLLINAAEAIGENAGTVRVTTDTFHFSTETTRGYLSEGELHGEYIRLEVSDNGHGMDPETVSQIFDPFFTTKFMGRGLGLSAVLGIVRGHKGAIRVTSAPGLGTSFELLFPSTRRAAAAANEDDLAKAPAEPLRQAGHGTMLVVDDESVVQNFFRLALEREGYDIVIAKDGAEALQIFSSAPDRFSMVLLDIVMPVMTGKELLPRLLEIRPKTRIVITSGQVEEEVRRELGGWSIAGFIQKPCPVRRFVEQIRAVAETET
jgi:CheY-like chemotaxis protein